MSAQEEQGYRITFVPPVGVRRHRSAPTPPYLLPGTEFFFLSGPADLACPTSVFAPHLHHLLPLCGGLTVNWYLVYLWYVCVRRPLAVVGGTSRPTCIITVVGPACPILPLLLSGSQLYIPLYPFILSDCSPHSSQGKHAFTQRKWRHGIGACGRPGALRLSISTRTRDVCVA